jgi:signal peptidase I
MAAGSNRKIFRRARDLVQATRKLLRINRDAVDESQQRQLSSAANNVASAVAKRDAGAAGTLGDGLEQLLNQVFPRPAHASLRENVEVLLVALIVAMGVRTFFIQPFKIPTGSMQPTLYGVYPPPDRPPSAYDGDPPSLPERIVGTVFEGKIYTAGGYRTRGDHIFVDKISYHFRRPTRGEVIVFDTQHVPNPRGKFYIKRLIALDGDTVQIQPPYVIVNGNILDDRPIFHRMYSREDGYSGYVLPATFEGSVAGAYFNSPESVFHVRRGHLLAMGDNSRSSYDGRFWGDFPRTDLVGRAVLVYWPFAERWGWIE